MANDSDRETHDTLFGALTAVQEELPHVGKNQTADTGKFKYKYVDLETVQDAVLPVLRRHGLVWITAPTLTPEGFGLRYELRHEEGESITGVYHLPASDSQAIGSAITYARRYALCAVTGLAPGGDDDDGAKDSRRPASFADAAAPVDRAGADALAAIRAAKNLTELQAAWEAAGRSGATRLPQVVQEKDKRKAALSG